MKRKVIGSERVSISERELRENFARNLVNYRRQAGLTQSDLADKLNYSDKSVSKWERGEGLPDLINVATIADLFGVTVNDLLSNKKKAKPFLARNKIIITALSAALVWLAAIILFFIFTLLLPSYPAWKVFIYAMPVTAIVLVVLSGIWWTKLCQFLSVSLLVWSIPTCFIVTFAVPKMSLIFAVFGVVQVMAALWFLIRK